MKGLLAMVLAVVSVGFPGHAAAQTPKVISIRLTSGLSSGSNHAGDNFTATLAEPLVMGNRIVAENDALVTGQVRDVVSSGRLSRPASITLSVQSVQTRSARYPLETSQLTVKEDSHATRNVLIIGGSAGAGAVLGGAADGGQGAAIGALAGMGAGTLGAFLTGKREITLPPETVLTFYVTTFTVSPKELAKLQPLDERLSDDDPPRAKDEDYDSYRVTARHRHEGNDEDDDRGRVESRDILFTSFDRSTIVHWFGRDRDDLPPGLAKRDHLPPGLEKQLRQRGTLPPGLQKRAAPLPSDLERQLSPLPRGYRRVVISGSVILMDENTSIICDIISLP